MEQNKEIRKQAPTLEQVPVLLLTLTEKFEQFIQDQQRKSQETPLENPIGITDCALFLTEIENKRVSVGAVYCRIQKKTIPFHKNGGKAYFYKSEILEYLRKPRKERAMFFQEAIN